MAKAIAPNILTYIGLMTPFILSLVGGLIAYGSLKRTVLDTKKDVGEIQADIKESEYVKKTDFKDYQHQVCRKIDEIKSLVIDLHNGTTNKIEKLDEKRELVKDQHLKQMEEIKILIAEVKTRLDRGI